MKKSAIVIDDDDEFVDMLCVALESLDIEIVGTGSNGQECLDLYLQHKPDFIFTDLTMPPYDIFYGIDKMKAIDVSSKIIVVTADTSMDTVQKLEERGITSVIFKPYTIDSIKKAIS
ncbi:MAG: response regulator [Nitrosopumilus sp.]